MNVVQRLWVARREPLILAILTVIAIVFFTVVLSLTRSYRRQQEKLARVLSAEGAQELRARNFAEAARYYRAALRYSRDNYLYQLRLAQALLAANRGDEAYAYLLSLWDREPENGMVNLELARVFAARGSVDQATRYYHNAIYAIWDSDSDKHRRTARLELVDFLLRHGATAQAESELIAFAANLPDDPKLHAQAAAGFLAAQDYQHALEQYRLVLKSDRKSEEAQAGAGRAAFELGRYTLAQHYLRNALALNPKNQQAAQLLQTTTQVLQMDPFGRRLSDEERSRRVLDAFRLAGDRLKACGLLQDRGESKMPVPASPPSGLQALASAWLGQKPNMTLSRLRRTPQLRDNAMDLVFSIEQEAENKCGPATGNDFALLLVSQNRERTE
jgi:tetratricopeptide (TPR) repeat protein